MGEHRGDDFERFAIYGAVTGFSEAWLRLREPADAAARASQLTNDLAAHLSGRSAVHFCDLGCGTGANLRYTALAIPSGISQHWQLFDHDARLLSAADVALRQWAPAAVPLAREALRLSKEGRDIRVRFRKADLNRDIELVIQPGTVLTASAFFDLVSPAWIERFAKAAARGCCPIYAPMIYNGLEKWSPPHPADGAMLGAFLAHQRRDKGFGAASGPKAAAALEKVLLAEGYVVKTAQSPWRLDDRNPRLIELLAEGHASAVDALALFDKDSIAGWAAKRKQATCVIGHTDLVAFPQG